MIAVWCSYNYNPGGGVLHAEWHKIYILITSKQEAVISTQFYNGNPGGIKIKNTTGNIRIYSTYVFLVRSGTNQ